MYSPPFSHCIVLTLSLLFLLCQGGSASHLTTDERQYILSVHNAERRSISLPLTPDSPSLFSLSSPSSTSSSKRRIHMNSLVWDDHVARRAQALAEECEREVSTHYGSNAAMLSASMEVVNASKVVNQWALEKEYYDVVNNTCSNTCTHYKQMVWPLTRSMGCGVSECMQGKSVNVVCLYWPSGDLNLRPYEYASQVPTSDSASSPDSKHPPISTPNDARNSAVETVPKVNRNVVRSIQETPVYSNTTTTSTTGGELTSGQASSTTTTANTTTTSDGTTITSGQAVTTSTTQDATSTGSSSTTSTTSATSATPTTSSSSTSSSPCTSTTGGASTTGVTSTTNLVSTSTTGSGECCVSCSVYASCNAEQCACECIAGFYGTGQSCEPIGDPGVSTSRWEYEDALSSTWRIENNLNKIYHTGAFSRVVWANLIFSKFGTAYIWEAKITPYHGSLSWGLIFKSYDKDNMYLVGCNKTHVGLSAYYKGKMYSWAGVQVDWANLVVKNLKVSIDGDYYTVYLDGVRIPANTTYDQGTVQGMNGVSGLMGVYANGDVSFSDMRFTSVERVTLHVSSCPNISSIIDALSSFGFSSASYAVSTQLDPACTKRSFLRNFFGTDDTKMGIEVYGNSTHSAVTLIGTLITRVNDIFKAHDIPVTSVDPPNANANVNPSEVVTLPLKEQPNPPIPIDSADGDGISTAVEATIIVLSLVGFFGIVAVVVVMVYLHKKRKPYSRRRGPEVNSMHIPQYPQGPLSLDGKKKKGKRGTMFDILGLHSPPTQPGKSESQIELRADDLTL